VIQLKVVRYTQKQSTHHLGVKGVNRTGGSQRELKGKGGNPELSTRTSSCSTSYQLLFREDQRGEVKIKRPEGRERRMLGVHEDK